MSKTAIIISAGITGVCTAKMLRRTGVDVTVMDRNKPATADQASFGNARLLARSAITPVSSPWMSPDLMTLPFDKRAFAQQIFPHQPCPLGTRDNAIYKGANHSNGTQLMRTAKISRDTAETKISVEINLDGTGVYDNQTGVGFFDHMLDQLSRHALIDMTVRATGDLHIDDHHTVEDVGIALGKALTQAVGDKKGIRRYGSSLLAMDDALVRAALDLSGRPYLVWKVDIPTQKIGTFDTELVREFFTAFAMQGGITLHVEALDGFNSHHIVEAAFKAVAQALRAALETDPRKADAIPSTKGTLSE